MSNANKMQPPATYGVPYLASAINSSSAALTLDKLKKIMADMEAQMIAGVLSPSAPPVLEAHVHDADPSGYYVDVTHRISRRELAMSVQNSAYGAGILVEMQRRVADHLAVFAVEEVDTIIKDELRAAIRAEVQKAVAEHVEDFLKEMLE